MEENEWDDDLFDHFDEEEEIDDFPELTLADVNQLRDTGQTGPSRQIVIQEKTIPGLSEIVAIANKDNRPISIEECVLAEVRIASANIDISVDESLFAQKVDFKNAVFSGRLNFWDADFAKEADFSGAVFSEEVHFEDCRFDKEVNFTGAVFKKRVAFTSCDFEGEIVFDDARFAGEVDFSNSTFRRRASYKGALFDKTIDLSNVRFEVSPDMTGSNLADMKKDARVEQQARKKTYQKRVKPKTEFNPWRELDRASKKSMSRRELLRGVFRFLPEKNEK